MALLRPSASPAATDTRAMRPRSRGRTIGTTRASRPAQPAPGAGATRTGRQGSKLIRLFVPRRWLGIREVLSPTRDRRYWALDAAAGFTARWSTPQRSRQGAPIVNFCGATRTTASCRSLTRVRQKSSETKESQTIDHLPGFGDASLFNSIDEHRICRELLVRGRTTEQGLFAGVPVILRADNGSVARTKDIRDCEPKVGHCGQDHPDKVGPAGRFFSVGKSGTRSWGMMDGSRNSSARARRVRSLIASIVPRTAASTSGSICLHLS